jgi:hypothetical protein
MHRWIQILILLIGLAFAYSASATDIYTLVDEDCRIERGLIVYVDDVNVELLSLEGELRTMTRDRINYLVLHNSFENPIPDIHYTEKLRKYGKKIFIQDISRADFQGWPVKLVENLVVFMDVTGKNHVVDLNHILRIRPFDDTSSPKTLNYKSLTFSYSDSGSQCLEKQSHKNGLIASRVLGDKIQISEFLNTFENGYENIDSFQERTYLYAKPFLFDKLDKNSRLGIVFNQNDLEQQQREKIPLYFQWTTGNSYNFQSFNRIGNIRSDLTGTAEPLLLWQSEVKSHFFHASFVGNLNALPADNKYFVDQFADDYEGFSKEEKTLSGTALNYAALMGIDYERWSLSFGSYHPVFYVQRRKTSTDPIYFREILASKTSPMLRLRYTLQNWQFKALASVTQLDANPVTDRNLWINNYRSGEGLITRMTFQSQLFRAGAQYDIDDKLRIGADFIYLKGNYQETDSGDNNNVFNFCHFKQMIYIHKQFGEYVALAVYGNYIIMKQHYTIANKPGSETINQFILGGNFEFVF